MASFVLPPGGMDIFYLDESAGDGIFVMASVRVPMVRARDDRFWVVWPEYHELAQEWRRSLSRDHHIKFRPELHSSDLLAGKGLLHKSGRTLHKDEAAALFASALQRLNFLPEASILVSSATQNSSLFGEVKMQAALLAMLQRLGTQTAHEQTGGMVFFDEGHAEYSKLYRKSLAYMPVGSSRGGWADGASKNKPLSRFIEDGNQKRSDGSFFLQVADLSARRAAGQSL